MGEIKLVPEIRFPEFKKSWEERKTKDIAPLQRGFDLTVSNTKDGEYPVVYSNGILRSHNEFKVKGPGVITGRSGTIGKVSYVKSNYWPHNTSLWVTDFKGNHPKYIYYFYKRFKLERYNAGSTVPTLNRNDVHSIKKRIPTLPEQQKIATFLTSIDERIQLLEKKKLRLEEYKKGVMQKIFSQEIRFKDEKGNDYPEWEEKKLGDIGYFQTSSVNKLSNKDEKEVYLVNYMNVYRHEDINNVSKKGFQIVTAKDSQIETSNLLKGDILFTPSSETPDDIGHSAVIFEDLDNTVFSYHLIRFRPVMKLNLLYSHYFCNIPSVARQLSRFATGSTRFTISLGNFSKVKIHIPHVNEQQKIASFLSSIEDSIEQVAQQIEHSKTYKKGLLQKMFV